MLEKDIELQCLHYLTRNGWFAFKVKDQAAFRNGAYQKGSSYQIRGVSDIIAVRTGITLFIEVKTPTGTQSKHQKAFQNRLDGEGVPYILVRSVDELKSALSRL